MPYLTGQCACGALRYTLTAEPMIVHCCHCRWCQRETGSAFVINAVIETEYLGIEGTPDYVMTPSESGKGQEIARCPACRVALWSHYASRRRKAAFVRVGTLADPDACPPDVQIFTATKQPWVILPPETPAFADFYPDPGAIWTPAARARWQALKSG